MPTPPLSEADKRATVDALRKAGGRVTLAASLLGIARGTISTRKLALLADPKWAKRVTPPPGTAATLTSDPTVHRRDVVADARGEAEKQRKRADEAEARLERERAARRKVKPVKPAKKRSGRDDTIRVIFPDLHGSYQDRAAVAAFMGDVKRISPHHVVGLGDLIDAGGFLAQHHTWGYVAETSYTYEDDIAAAGVFLDGLQKAAPSAEFDLLEGNHCARPERWAVTAALRNGRDSELIRQAIAPERLLEFKRRGIKYYRRSVAYDGLPVQGTIRRGKVCFVHGHSTSTNVAAVLARKFNTNVVGGHVHRVQNVMINSVSGGTIGAWTIGCLSQRQPLWQHGSCTDWVHAFAIQIVARSGAFLHFTVPIINGVSLMPEMGLR